MSEFFRHTKAVVTDRMGRRRATPHFFRGQIMLDQFALAMSSALGLFDPQQGPVLRPGQGADIAFDLMMGGACISIAAALWVHLRKRENIAFNWATAMMTLYVAFMAVIHLLDAWHALQPIPGAHLAVKLAALPVALLSGVAIWFMIPYVLQLAGERRSSGLKDRLQQEVVQRSIAEDELRRIESTYRVAPSQMLDRLRLQFELMPIPCILQDQDGRTTYINPAAESVFGYTLAEMVGRNPAELICPASGRDFDAQFAERLKSGEVISGVQVSNIDKDGQSLTLEWYKSPLHDHDRRYIGILSMARDVTELQRSESELRLRTKELEREKELLQTVLDNIPVLVTGYTAEDKRLLVNRCWENTLGWSKAEAQDPRIPQRIAGSEEDWRRLNGLVTKLGEYREERQMCTRSGAIIDVVWYGKLLSDGRRVVMSQDISERKKSEAALAESEQRFSSMFASAAVGMGVRSADPLQPRLLRVNRRFCEMLGYSEEELLSLTTLDLAHPEERETAIRRNLDLVDGIRNPGSWERRYVRKDGTSIWAETTLSAVNGSDGKPLYCLLVAQDITARKIAETRLRESEERYRDMFISNPMPMWIRDQESLRILDVNRAAERMYGYSREELLDMRIDQLRVTEEVGSLQSVVDSADPMKDFSTRHRHRRKDGTEMIVDSVSRPFSFEGRAARLALLKDVTAEEAAYKALRESEKRLRTITDNVPALIGYIDKQFRYQFVNRAYETWYGTPATDYVGRALQDLVDPQLLDFLMPHMQQALSGQTVTIERRTRSRVRRQFARFTYVPHRNDDGTVAGFYVLGYDITDSRIAEEELSQERTLLRQILDAVPDPLYVKDTGLRYLLVNTAGLRARGVTTSDHVVGKTAFAFYPREMAEVFDTEDDAVMRTGIPLVNREQRVTDINGRERWQLVNKVALRDPDGKVTGIVAIGRDITELKQSADLVRTLNAELEQRVKERTAQLEIVNKELESFAYSVSHDLRSPLRSIDGFSQALLEEYGPRFDSVGQDYLERVRRASKRMGALIDDLLMLSRITRSDIRRSTVDLSAMVHDIVADLQKSHPDRSVRCAVAAGVLAEADARLVRVALENLLDNAWKFTGKLENAEVEFGVEESAEGRILFVRDNGAGFDMDYAQNLFGAFQRLHTEAQFPGTGIGLATVQRVVRLHGGTIRAEAKPGGGATFYFTLEPEPHR